MTAIIFLDIDGVMIPTRAGFIQHKNQGSNALFDPIATAMLNSILSEIDDVKIVISSIHRLAGYSKVKLMLERNGLPRDILHSDWQTTTDRKLTRTQEIQLWLNRHPEITTFVIVDDQEIDHDNAVKCNTDNGISMQNYYHILQLLKYPCGTENSNET